MLLSHLGGIRHYVKKGEKSENELSEPNKSKDSPPSTREKEVYNKEKFDSISKALTLFQDDELMSKPGTEYLYTTHGWTLVCKYLALLCTNIASSCFRSVLSSRELVKRNLLSRLNGFSPSLASATQNWMSPIQSYTIEQSKHILTPLSQCMTNFVSSAIT